MWLELFSFVRVPLPSFDILAALLLLLRAYVIDVISVIDVIGVIMFCKGPPFFLFLKNI
jgi:hypothetical protein